VIASTEQHWAKWQTAGVMGTAGALFLVLALSAGNLFPLWLAAAAINFIGAADSCRHHSRAALLTLADGGVTVPREFGPRLVGVVCPHCGMAFAIDTDKETLASESPTGVKAPGTPMVFRPVCPACWERVTVRV
jgi:hypothetical protein